MKNNLERKLFKGIKAQLAVNGLPKQKKNPSAKVSFAATGLVSKAKSEENDVLPIIKLEL